MSNSVLGSNKMQSISINNCNAIINAPNWELIPYKSMQTPSKDELNKQIKDLAAKGAVAVTGTDFEYVNQQQ